jgi:hypothetical protein
MDNDLRVVEEVVSEHLGNASHNLMKQEIYQFVTLTVGMGIWSCEHSSEGKSTNPSSKIKSGKIEIKEESRHTQISHRESDNIKVLFHTPGTSEMDRIPENSSHKPPPAL